MIDPMLIFGGIAVLLATFLIVYVWWHLRARQRLSRAVRVRIQRAWDHAQTIKDPAMRVIEAEKVVDQLFGALGYSGSFGDKLKKAGSRLQNENAVWSAHKLRNRLAHETGVSITEREADQSVKAFGVIVRMFAR